MRGVLVFVLAATLGLAVVAADWALAAQTEAVRLEGLALLRAPDGGATMIRALRAGETVTVLGRRGDYVSVALADGTRGYVYGGFLTGFAEIKPLAAYASRIDASVTRPGAAAPPSGASQPSPKVLPVASESPAGSRLTYTPVADGGGLALYMANLSRPAAGASSGGLDERIAEFNASKNHYSIEVRLSQRKLYLYENLPDGSRRLAHVYTVAVPGRDMEAPQGWGVVTGISFEPWWRPTEAMKERARKKGRQLPEVVKPGVRENPMGQFKIILSHGSGFRIHGNNNPGSIGRPVTSGCIRMRNDEGKDMAKLIDVGTEVVFLQ